MNKNAAKKIKDKVRPKIKKHGGDRWRYFVPTDSHLFGFSQAIETIGENQIASTEIGENREGLREYAEEVIDRFDKKDRSNNYNNEDFNISNIQRYGSNSAVVTAKKSSGKLATFFFYYDVEPEDKGIYRNGEFEIVDISPISDQVALVLVETCSGDKVPFLFIWVGAMGFWCCFRAKNHIVGMQGAIGEEQRVEKYNFEKNFREVNGDG